METATRTMEAPRATSHAPNYRCVNNIAYSGESLLSFACAVFAGAPAASGVFFNELGGQRIETAPFIRWRQKETPLCRPWRL